MNFFCVDRITAGYGKSKVIENISFEMERGSMTGILGANGSGKTTFLKSVGSILPHSGTCSLNGLVLEELSARRMAQLVSYIPQRSGISIDISALDVVLMGFNPRLGLLEHPSQTMKEAAQKALEQVGLGSKEQTNYLHLSEGQKQLCILARTLVSECQLLLLDEPESALDFRYRHLMLDLLRSWIREHQTGALITLHDPMLALNYCDQLLLFNEGVLIGELRPQYHSLTEMEELLAKVYGAVSLHRCSNHGGKEFIMMLKEEA
ncbi:MAG: ABC transporter ATP-binding protein [Firmicutes bacterium]|nr:ABC transporter ATP-binding protein [Bacillota bacterium]